MEQIMNQCSHPPVTGDCLICAEIDDKVDAALALFAGQVAEHRYSEQAASCTCGWLAETDRDIDLNSNAKQWQQHILSLVRNPNAIAELGPCGKHSKQFEITESEKGGVRWVNCLICREIASAEVKAYRRCAGQIAGLMDAAQVNDYVYLFRAWADQAEQQAEAKWE
jgi:hypothetical protein